MCASGPSPSAVGSPSTKMLPVRPHATVLRRSLVRCMSAAVPTSSMLTVLVMAAPSSNKKNAAANALPHGNWANTCGMVMNAKAGPLAGLRPKANTAGKIIKAATSANEVSPTLVKRAVLGSECRAPA